jgi:hypothetical protein
VWWIIPELSCSTTLFMAFFPSIREGGSFHTLYRGTDVPVSGFAGRRVPFTCRHHSSPEVLRAHLRRLPL